MNKCLVYVFFVLFMLLLFGACQPPPVSDVGVISKEDHYLTLDAEVEMEREETEKAKPKEIVPVGSGLGELTVYRFDGFEDANGGVTESTLNGTIPFSIDYNKNEKVWKVLGIGGVGTTITSYNATKPQAINCKSTWNVEFTLTGVLVPIEGMITDRVGEGTGCYLLITTSEKWGDYEGSCVTAISGYAQSQGQQDVMYDFGPFKFKLINGESVHQDNIVTGVMSTYKWTLKNLIIPPSSGCSVLY